MRGDFGGMGDFGTGLREHLQTTRSVERDRYEAPPSVDEPLLAEQRRLEALASELAGRELQLLQREADMAAEHEQMAYALARVLIEHAQAPRGAEPPVLDELAALRARRRAS